ncbi:MAG: GGDEF domain-containing protein [Acidobacteria bacterium]|nr:GGDEF domain-containing protein [Acidobacteriota bacterium]
MNEAQPSPSPKEEVFKQEKRDWQLWSLLVLGLGLFGLGLAVYLLLRAPASSWTPQGAAQLFPPMLFGVISLIVLINFYVAQKDAIIRGLEQEVIKQKIEAELNRELALLDPVTEVYNRRYLRVLLAKEVSRVKRYGKGLSVMLVDITGFRKVNESLGHTGGDVVLRQIAHLLQTRIRNSDFIVRFGGDEFLVVLPDTDDAGVYILGRRLKEGMREWSRRSGMDEFALKLAIGVAKYSADRPVDELLKLAEQRMVLDKRATETDEKPAEAGAHASEGAIS